MTYVIIRGSVPVFWEQKGMIEGVTLSRGPEMTKKAFQKHFEDLLSTYQQVFLVDLLSDTKAREIILTKEYVR
jgi:synaptojanin